MRECLVRAHAGTFWLRIGASTQEDAVSPLEPVASAISAAVFDALPFPAVVADGDVRVLAANQAARRLLNEGDVSERRQRVGESLRCINSTDGCGKSEVCKDCVIRSLANFAISGGEPARRRARLEYHDQGSVQQMYALVTASPLAYDGRPCALICIENLTLLLSLADALPICMGCKKVRDEGLWLQVEAYLDSHLDLKFTHGLCPECSRRLYPEHFEAIGDRDAG